MKDLDKKLKDGVITLTCEQEKELVDAWLKYDSIREKASPFSITGELAELIAAISKYERGPADRTEENWLNIAEEIADVQIVTAMAKILYGVDDELLSKIRTLKLTVPIPETDDTKTDKSFPETDNKSDAIANQVVADRMIYTTRNLTVCSGLPVLDVNKRNDVSNQNVPDTCNAETQKNELTEMIKLIHDFNDDVTELMKLTYSAAYPAEGIIKMSDCYGNSSWIDMPEGSRRLRISKCLNKARAVVKHERSIRDHFTITNNSLNGSVDICNYIHNTIEKISRMMRDVIFIIRGSNIDPYFWSFPKTTVETSCLLFWASGIELLANWISCIEITMSQICRGPMLRKHGYAFWANRKDMYGKPLAIPSILYDIFICLRTGDDLWLRQNSAKDTLIDIIKDRETDDLVSKEGVEQAMDDIFEYIIKNKPGCISMVNNAFITIINYLEWIS